MTYAEQILELLQSTGQRFCDDCIAAKLRMKARQQAYQRCSQLAAQDRIDRDSTCACDGCGKVKITSRSKVRSLTRDQIRTLPAEPVKRHVSPSRPWFWEGHVQGNVVSWLQGCGWEIRQYANTALKTPGKDIIAHRHDRMMWVTVKGYPEGTAKTNPCTQARHWFSHAMFDLVCYRNESPTVELAVAIPACGVTYRNLSARSAWLMRTLPASILWVSESGTVSKQDWN